MPVLLGQRCTSSPQQMPSWELGKGLSQKNKILFSLPEPALISCLVLRCLTCWFPLPVLAQGASWWKPWSFAQRPWAELESRESGGGTQRSLDSSSNSLFKFVIQLWKLTRKITFFGCNLLVSQKETIFPSYSKAQREEERLLWKTFCCWFSKCRLTRDDTLFNCLLFQ